MSRTRTLAWDLAILLVGACVPMILIIGKADPTLIVGTALIGAGPGALLLLCDGIRTPRSRIVATGLIFGLMTGSSNFLISRVEVVMPAFNVLTFFIGAAVGAGFGSIPRFPYDDG